MLIILTGTDDSSIGSEITLQKEKCDPLNIHEFIFPQATIEGIKDTLYATNLFSNNDKLIVIYPKKATDLELTESELQYMKVNDDITVVIQAQPIQKQTNIFKLLKKYGTVQDYSLPKDYAHFNISDAIFLYRDKKKALQLINDLDSIDQEAIPLIGTLQFTLRAYVSKQYDNDAWKALHPFVKKKITQMNMSEEQVLHAYDRLAKLDFDIKSTSGSTRSCFQDFVVYL